jgi:hypothetical protein
MTIPKPHLHSLSSHGLQPLDFSADPERQAAAAGSRSIIGWREWVALPTLGIQRLDAKIDTGARSSSLDVHSIEEFRKQKQLWVRFRILDDIDMSMSGRIVEAKLLEYRNVRASSGHVMRRPVILTELSLGAHSWEVELTLSNRQSMGYRMLVGRLAIEERFLVDASRSHLSGSKADCAAAQP